MDALALARLQFAVTTVYHFFFVPLTLGLSILVAIMETLYVRTGNETYKRMTKFWGKLFLINFAVGVVTGIVQDFARVGQCGIAHPDPGERAALHQRVAAHAHVRRGVRDAWNMHAAAVRFIRHAVVAADDPVAVEPALGERERTVRAAVIQGDRRTLARAVHDDAPLQQGAAQQFAADLRRAGGDVPGVANERGGVIGMARRLPALRRILTHGALLRPAPYAWEHGISDLGSRQDDFRAFRGYLRRKYEPLYPKLQGGQFLLTRAGTVGRGDAGRR